MKRERKKEKQKISSTSKPAPKPTPKTRETFKPASNLKPDDMDEAIFYWSWGW